RNIASGTRLPGTAHNATLLARCRIPPEVFNVRKFAPWANENAATASPPSTVAGRIADSADPTRWPDSSSGSPSTVVASMVPTTSGGSHEPAMMTKTQPRRQRAESTLPRYSKATPRPISANNNNNNNKYAPDHNPAYHAGKAANMTPTATISQTSFPSQTGPIVLTTTRRSVLSRPNTGSSMPTPKSNPSRKR